jgi:hypothetical protein
MSRFYSRSVNGVHGCAPGRRGLLASLGVLLTPAPFGRASAKQPASQVRRVAFDFPQESAIMLVAEVGGRKANVLLDTGAASTLVDTGLADRLGWSLQGSRTLRGNSARASAHKGEPFLLSIAGSRLPIPSSEVIDLSVIASSLGAPIDLVLGKHLFEAAVVELDFARRLLAVGDDVWAARGKGVDLPLDTGPHGQRLLSVRVEGRSPIPAVMDLGSSNPLMLSGDYATSAGLLGSRPTSTAAIAGVEGVEISTSFITTTLEVGGYRLKRLPSEALPHWLEAEIPANIGLPVLSRFRVICDFAHDRVHLSPGPRMSGEFDRDRSGLGVAVHTNELIVVHVARGSPAQSAGFVAGDRIIAVDGQPIGPSYLRAGLWRWRSWSPGRRVILRLSAGVTKNLVLRDYY